MQGSVGDLLRSACIDGAKYRQSDSVGKVLAHISLLPYLGLFYQTAVVYSRREISEGLFLLGSLVNIACGRILKKAIHQLRHPEDTRILPAWCNAFIAVGSALAVTLSPANAREDLTITFRASRDPQIRLVQKSLVEAWGYVETQFMEPDFDHQKWSNKLQDSINETYKTSSADDAYKVTDRMLATLGDPFTRLLRPGLQAAAFQDTTEGQIKAIGLQLASMPENRLQVGLVLNDSPAQSAGVQAGDDILEINGLSVQSKSKEDWAEELKQEADLKLARHSDRQASGLPGSPQPENYSVHLVPAPIEVHPVQYSALRCCTSLCLISQNGKVTGYVRIVVFSQNAAADVQHAIQELVTQDDASAFILDLRDNSGGIVGSGYNIAQLLLNDGDGFCIVRFGTGEEEVVKMQDTTHLVSQPLVVLVNGGTASTSELLAGALHDAAGVPLVGEKTFGKGVTQRVVPLSDGSVLLVSTASYMTPNHMPVHKVGLQPDLACVPEVTQTEYWVAGSRDSEDLSQDPCIQMAQDKLSSMQPNSQGQ
ncbi:hypothetical protein WJX79_010735 [Trebouxia sp. C0005]